MIALARSADSAKEARLRFLAVRLRGDRLFLLVRRAAMRHPSKKGFMNLGAFHTLDFPGCQVLVVRVNQAPVCRSSVLPS